MKMKVLSINPILFFGQVPSSSLPRCGRAFPL